MPPIDPYTSAERRQPSPGWAAVRGFARMVRRNPVTVVLAVVAASLLTGAATQATAGNTVVLATAGLLIGCAAGMLHRSAPDRRLLAARPGLAQTQLLILGAVIAAIVVLSIGGIAIYRSTTSGASDSVAKSNVDRMIASAEDYWQQYALKRDGTRSASFDDLCNYFNSQFTVEDDLTIRSIGVGTTAAATGAQTTGAVAVATADISEVAAAAQRTGRRASCPSDFATAVENLDASTDPAGTAAAATTARVDDFAEWGDRLGMAHNRAMFVAPANQLPTTGTAPAGWAPATEGIVVGAVNGTGNSFCAVVVFDATDRSHVGAYRFSGAPDTDGNPVLPGDCFGDDAINIADAGGGWQAAS